MGKRLVRFDWAIKRLLRDKANFVVLEGFLSELLFQDIKIVQILESESNQQYDLDKFNRVDILAQGQNNELIIIEIQNTYEIDYFHRMAYGASKTVSEHMALGSSYSDVKKVISVNIVYFDLGQGKDYIYKGKTEFRGLHQEDILQLSDTQKKTFMKQNVADIFPEYYLIKVNNFNDIARSTLDEWIYFLKNSEVQDSFKAKGLKEAQETLDVMRLNAEQRYGYNRHLDYLHLKASEALSLELEMKEKIEKMFKEGIEQGIQQGIQQGIEQKAIEIAKKMIKRGYDTKTIAEDTGLSIEQIQDLIKNLDN